MRFPESFLDEIRARLPVSTVVGRRVKLRKAGREWKGLSPFNQERTPSFTVNDQKGMWFDFSAGRNGNIFSFLMATEGISFQEAVERLAAEAGVPLPARDPRAEEREKERASLHEVVELAAQFFEAALQSRGGAAARGYLANRGLTADLQRRFRIGYAPESRSGLKEHLAGKGIAHEQMVDAGLLVTGDDIPVSFDRFRDRIIFPIGDFRGRIVAFGGRALSADVPAKYLNSPETVLFHKGALLYNGAEARKAAQDAGSVIVVEGYVDVIQMAGAGFTNTVAPLGTALTERQLEILWRMADEPVLCFDGDGAGLRAAFRAVDLALPLLQPGKSIRFALLPEGQDPDDLIRSSGREAMAAVIAAARPLVEMIWARETEAGVFDTPERRAALEARLREIARAIGDDSVRRHYIQAFAERVAAFFPDRYQVSGARYQGRRGRRRDPFLTPDTRYLKPGSDTRHLTPDTWHLTPVSDRLRRTPILSGRSAISTREAVLVMTMVNHPSLIEAHHDDFAGIDFAHAELGRLRDAVLDVAALVPDFERGHAPDSDPGPGAPDAERLRESLAAARFGPLIARLDGLLAAIGHWPAGTAAADEDAERGWHQALTLHRRKRTLHKDLRDAEAALAESPSDANLARLVDIQSQLARSEGTEALIEGFGDSSGRRPRLR